MIATLAGRTCNEKEARRLGAFEIKILKEQLPRWKLLKGKVLESGYKFPDFKKAWQFTNRVAKLAEAQGHRGNKSVHAMD
jgi:pterin-4a-carbinolamine dehydratase